MAKRSSAKRTPATRSSTEPNRCWLLKSEPDVFSIDDLAQARKKTTAWDGVRNYQARNYLRDEMKLGDLVLFYHSNAKPPAIVGIAKVVREGYPDSTAFDPQDDHYDPKSKPDSPTWFVVDIQLIEKFKRPVTLPELRELPELAYMVLLRRGSRLSVQPITATELEVILSLVEVSKRFT